MASKTFGISGEPGVSITVTELTDAPNQGALQFTIKVVDVLAEGDITLDTADLRGVFFDIADETLLSSLSVVGPHATSYKVQRDAVVTVGGDVNMQGGTGPEAFDVGVEIGTSGMGKDDFQEATFILKSSTSTLSLSLLDKSLFETGEGSFGVRLTSVGAADGKREASLKLTGNLPEIPDPVGSLGNRVWIDTNGNGQQDEGTGAGTGVDGVVVYLFKADGTPVMNGNVQVSTITANGGFYQFDGLPVGDYKVQFELPEPYKTTHQFTGLNSGGESVDSDALSTGMTADTFKVTANTLNDTADAGIKLKPVAPQPDPDGYDDLIEGGGGDDWLFGGKGSDEMQGEGGNDFIIGGTDKGSITQPTSVKIGDNLYGNGGNDTYLYAKGDGVDLIWDFNPGEDTIRLHGFSNAEATSLQVAYVRGVENRIGTNNHDKIALIFNGGADGAIIFNDFPGPKVGDNAIQFVMPDGSTVTYSTAQLVEMAKLSTVTFGAPQSTPGAARVLGTPVPTNPSQVVITGNTVTGASQDDQLYAQGGPPRSSPTRAMTSSSASTTTRSSSAMRATTASIPTRAATRSRAAPATTTSTVPAGRTSSSATTSWISRATGRTSAPR